MARNLHVNGSIRTVAADAETPLLYVLRNELGLNGAKFGCGLAQCGACTVLIGGRAVRSCVTPDRKSTRLNSSHEWISYAVFCLKKKKKEYIRCSGGSNTQKVPRSR